MAEPSFALLLQQLLGRAPMSPPELLRELNVAQWPDECRVHSADFMNLSQYFPLNRDDDGMYFFVGNTTVRPAGSDHTLDLTDYAGPPKIELAQASWDKR